MKTITPAFFIEKILLDHLPQKSALIKRVIEEHSFGRIVEGIISNVSDLLHPTGKQNTSPQEIAAYTYRAIKEINGRIVHISDPPKKLEAQGLLSDFFNAVIKEIALKKPSLAEQLNKEIINGLRLAVQLEGYDETDIFERIKLDDLNLPTDFTEAIERTRSDKIKPTRFKTTLRGPEIKFLGELLQQYGITRIKVQFENLFQNGKKIFKPISCTNGMQLHFIHFMYCLIIDFKWASIENAGVWEGIKESFVDQDKNFFDKKIKQYYHREIKKEEAKDLVIKVVDKVFEDFFHRFSDRNRTQSGR